VVRTLGTDYDSEWTRRYPARLGRVLLSELVTRPALHALASPRVAGLDRIAHLDEPVIFAANHASHLDTPLLLSVIPDRWRHRLFVAGAADYFFDTRLKAVTFAFLLNAVPIERQRVSRESANRVAALLAEGWSLLIYPEGGRSPDGWGQAHRAGAAWLAVRTERPVVPVHIEGTRQMLAKGSVRLKPGTTNITFGRPIRSVPGGDPRALAADLEAAVAALADEQTTDWWTARKRAAARTTPSLLGPEVGSWRRAWALEERTSRPRARGSRSGAGGWPRT
jgi:1-acyl-sn-glycerol-3-phosphate acyltransferase